MLTRIPRWQHIREVSAGYRIAAGAQRNSLPGQEHVCQRAAWLGLFARASRLLLFSPEKSVALRVTVIGFQSVFSFMTTADR